MEQHVAFAVKAVALGLPAGLLPGPLLTLVVSQAVRHGRRAGMRVAMAPLFSDAPIVAATVLVLSRLAVFHGILGSISLIGAVFLCILAYRSVQATSAVAGERPRSLLKGVAANVLNPNPYLFWFSVGAPLLVDAWQTGIAAALSFIVAFYGSLIGAKLAVAWAASHSRSFLDGRGYRMVTRILAVLLLAMAGWLTVDGLRLLGML